MSGPIPVDITLHRSSRMLEVAFDDGARFQLPCEYLRVYSPSAEVQGHSPEQRVLQTGKREVNIKAIDQVGQYAVRLVFDDGHDTGLYTWDKLYDLGQNLDRYWQDYLDRLKAAGRTREP